MPRFAQISIIKSMRLVLYCVAVLLFVQCSKADLAVSMTDVNINSWYETATIERINEDTESLYDLNIVLHVNNNFSSEDLEFEVVMTSPDAIRHTERIALSCDSSWEGITAHSNDAFTMPETSAWAILAVMPDNSLSVSESLFFVTESLSSGKGISRTPGSSSRVSPPYAKT